MHVDVDDYLICLISWLMLMVISWWMILCSALTMFDVEQILNDSDIYIYNGDFLVDGGLSALDGDSLLLAVNHGVMLIHLIGDDGWMINYRQMIYY